MIFISQRVFIIFPDEVLPVEPNKVTALIGDDEEECEDEEEEDFVTIDTRFKTDVSFNQ